MSDKIKNIFIGIIFFVVLILGTSFVIDTILIDGLKVDNGLIGSIVGGIIGMVGVIVTTYFIIEANKKSVEDSLKKQDKQARDRDYIALILTKAEELNHEIIKSTQIYKKIMDNFRITKTHQILINTYEDRFSLKRKDDGIYDMAKRDLVENNLKLEKLRNELTVCLNTLIIKNIYIGILSDQINGYEHTVNRNIEIIINSLDSIGNLNELEETFRWQNKYYINDSNKLLKDLNDFVVEKLSELRKGVS